ncbi:hypothetical protein BaRGS_00012188 [Batillaria attramentaria]|uniref:Uncharacterized protein n=1 Tax=Batillaria attramentaria TaxID=370345 RepID=A0ABD0LB71_9CAEN
MRREWPADDVSASCSRQMEYGGRFCLGLQLLACSFRTHFQVGKLEYTGLRRRVRVHMGKKVIQDKPRRN